jgi:hypothetical protein
MMTKSVAEGFEEFLSRSSGIKPVTTYGWTLE